MCKKTAGVDQVDRFQPFWFPTLYINTAQMTSSDTGSALASKVVLMNPLNIAETQQAPNYACDS